MPLAKQIFICFVVGKIPAVELVVACCHWSEKDTLVKNLHDPNTLRLKIVMIPRITNSMLCSECDANIDFYLSTVQKNVLTALMKDLEKIAYTYENNPSEVHLSEK